MTKQTVPAFSLSRHIKNNKEQFSAAINQILDNQQFIGGPVVDNCEKQLAQYLGVKHVISCNSGTDALWMALFALDIQKNDIVLTTPFSFIASSSEIASHGALPVFIDIDQETFNINPELLEAWLTKNTVIKDGKTIHQATGFPVVGMLPVDIFGQCADYPALKKIADMYHFWIIEDCAQALGASLNNQMAGTLGTIGTLSFYPTKNLGAFGDAGCCVTNDSALAEKLSRLRHHGRKNAYEYEFLGINSRMDAFQAAIISARLPLLDQMNAQRRAIAKRYEAALSSIPFIKTPKQIMGTHVYHQYGILINNNENRDALEKHLAGLGIQTRIFYPRSLQTIDFLNTNPALATSCPISMDTCNNILALPMWPELEDSEVDYVIEGIKSFAWPSQLKHTQPLRTGLHG